MDLSTYVQFFISLIALVNPIGAIPVFYSMTADFPEDEQKKMIFITSSAIMIMLLVTLFFGNAILSAFSISIDSFRIAGGLVIASIAMTMISGKIGEHKMNKEEKNMDVESYTNLAIVPLAVPLMAGPGSISAAIVLGSNISGVMGYALGAITIILFCILVYCLLRYSKPVMVKLGKTGANVITRIMGLILFSLGVELVVIACRNLGVIA